MSECANRGGSVLVLALWAVFLIVSLAIAAGNVVSSALGAAGRLRSRQVSRELAESAVERAWGAIAVSTNDATLQDMPGLFMDNGELGGGKFSVQHLAVDPTGAVVTNHGVAAMSQRLNLNRAGKGELAALLREKGELTEVEASSLADVIIECRSGRNGRLTVLHGTGYAPNNRYCCRTKRFQFVEELLLLDEVASRPGLYSVIAPFLTVFGKGCYGGTAVGVSEDGDVTRISFVVDRAGRRLYWHEY
ncbi:MAG: hypothetical protein FJ224_01715 [Lentisphaerae bacterium]|nr:hypothetical protein [Lentisphaerota bacterium]